MRKPQWKVRSSTMIVDTEYLRLRADELELEDGSIVANYFVRESEGFVVAFALTPDERVVTVRQYRYGTDKVHLELPAGGLAAGEDPRACAERELLEETGYAADAWEPLGRYHPEPVRSNSMAHVFLARGAKRVSDPEPEPTEILELELPTIDEFQAMLDDGRIDAGHCIVAGYRALRRLGRL